MALSGNNLHRNLVIVCPPTLIRRVLEISAAPSSTGMTWVVWWPKWTTRPSCSSPLPPTAARVGTTSITCLVAYLYETAYPQNIHMQAFFFVNFYDLDPKICTIIFQSNMLLLSKHLKLPFHCDYGAENLRSISFPTLKYWQYNLIIIAVIIKILKGSVIFGPQCTFVMSLDLQDYNLKIASVLRVNSKKKQVRQLYLICQNLNEHDGSNKIG